MGRPRESRTFRRHPPRFSAPGDNVTHREIRRKRSRRRRRRRRRRARRARSPCRRPPPPAPTEQARGLTRGQARKTVEIPGDKKNKNTLAKGCQQPCGRGTPGYFTARTHMEATNTRGSRRADRLARASNGGGGRGWQGGREGMGSRGRAGHRLAWALSLGARD